MQTRENLLNCLLCGAAIMVSPHTRQKKFCTETCRQKYNGTRRGTTVEARKQSHTNQHRTEARYAAIPKIELTNVHLSWLAAFWDGEGTIGISKHQKSFCVSVTVGNTNKALIDHVVKLLGADNVTVSESKMKNPKHRNLFRAQVRVRAVVGFLDAIHPFLIAKQRQAELVLAFRDLIAKAPCRSSTKTLCEPLYNECKILNKRGV